MNQTATELRQQAELLGKNIYANPSNDHEHAYNAAMADAADLLIARANELESA